MPQESATTSLQSIGNAGPLILAYVDPTGARATVSVSFIPTYARMTRPQPSALQVVNVAIGGQIHVYELSRNEPLTWTVEFLELPYLDHDVLQPIPTQGYTALQSFIRYTLSYAMNPCRVTSPDGFIETMRYVGGLDSFAEAQGQSQKVTRWNGQLVFARDIT